MTVQEIHSSEKKPLPLFHARRNQMEPSGSVPNSYFRMLLRERLWQVEVLRRVTLLSMAGAFFERDEGACVDLFLEGDILRLTGMGHSLYG